MGRIEVVSSEEFDNLEKRMLLVEATLYEMKTGEHLTPEPPAPPTPPTKQDYFLLAYDASGRIWISPDYAFDRVLIQTQRTNKNEKSKKHQKIAEIDTGDIGSDGWLDLKRTGKELASMAKQMTGSPGIIPTVKMFYPNGNHHGASTIDVPDASKSQWYDVKFDVHKHVDGKLRSL